MHGSIDSRRPQRIIGAPAKATFLAALRRGVPREDAAAEAGFSLTGFYGARRRDPAFAADWAEALAAPEAAGRRARAYEERGKGELRIASANRRLVQRQRRRHVRFTLERQELFLEHFAASGDTKAAAEAAGISEATVHLHRRLHAEFAECYDEALASAYPKLEADALRLRLEAQARLRAAVARGACRDPREIKRSSRAQSRGEVEGRGLTKCPTCGHDPDDDAQFDRNMRLLARRDRKRRRVDSRFTPGGRRQRWTFEEAIELLDKRMRALGLRSGPEEDGAA